MRVPPGALGAAPPPSPAPLQGVAGREPGSRVLKHLLQLRARRRRSPHGALLDWPAWDMLLDLAAVRAEGGHVSVSAVCISSGAPQSTALRKLSALEAAGLVRRYLHERDRRRVCLVLTDDAAKLVNAIVAEDLRFYRELTVAPPVAEGETRD